MVKKMPGYKIRLSVEISENGGYRIGALVFTLLFCIVFWVLIVVNGLVAWFSVSSDWVLTILSVEAERRRVRPARYIGGVLQSRIIFKEMPALYQSKPYKNGLQ